MNKSQYKRLCLVLLAPLLFAGFISSNTFLRSERNHWLLCEGISGEQEFCRRGTYTDHGDFYDSIKKKYPAWFLVEFPFHEKAVKLEVQVRQRVAFADEIIGTEPSFGYKEKAAYMDQMVGRKALISLGIIKDAKSEFVEALPEVFLACNYLSMDNKEPRVYMAHCKGEGWIGAITFKASAETELMLQGIKNQYYKELDDLEFNFWIDRISAWLIYVVLFLILSLIVYLIRTSINYVRFGSKKNIRTTELASK
ncbi:hypothetical protein EDC30_11933 [Paucimonas lemoignei]|uniref:Uncharacterized protein n=1 Tax=Paucimonas lemoignei TaxID=29443 RepID=A0A4R3HQA7_PAULE|nr:hypothetical protein [Paucimonas lemoignei]TCS32922.1 hypothetical protein EDC30_11933 [Paucimonas lemoignei]